MPWLVVSIGLQDLLFKYSKNGTEKMFSANNQEDLFICGDYNIDLLNAKKHKSTDDFLNMMCSNFQYPEITRPSRITTHSATLIDNIFTNMLDSNIVSGLLLRDISDHLAVFVVFDANCRRVNDTDRSRYARVSELMLSKLT